MKKALLIFSLFLGVLEASIEKATEEYAAALFEKFPDLMFYDNMELSIEDFKETLEKETDNFFFVDAGQKQLLNRKKNCISDEAFGSALTELKKSSTNHQESKFILTLIKKNPPSAYKQLFFYRYIKHIKPTVRNDGQGSGKEQMRKIFYIYEDTKKQLGRTPSFEELKLNPELKFFINGDGEAMNWIYVADAKEMAKKDPLPVIAHPIARASGRAECIREDGKMSASLHFSTLTKANTNTSDLTKAHTNTIQPAYLEKLKNSASLITKRHKIYLESDIYDEASDNSVKQLRFKNGEDVYSDKDGIEEYPWIYLGATHKVIAEKERVICVTSTPVDGQFHLGFFADNSHIRISQRQFNVILKKGLK